MGKLRIASYVYMLIMFIEMSRHEHSQIQKKKKKRNNFREMCVEQEFVAGFKFV